jgi:hypothetical protein
MDKDKNMDKDKKKDKDEKKDKENKWKLKDHPLVLFSIIGTVLTIIIIIIGIITIYLTKNSSNSQLCLYGVAKNGNCNQPCNYLVSVNDDNGDCKPIHNKKGDDVN